ncbi:MAG: ATP-binding protein [Actinomycetota bacterium]|nr:ATP-binding protein [Actinomycetota bacterium]
MPLRLRVSLAIVALLAIVLVVALPLAGWLMERRVAVLEDYEARHESEMVELALDANHENLGGIAEGWGAWDDAYRYVTDPAFRPSFESTDFNRETIEPVDVDAMAYFDADGALVGSVVIASRPDVIPVFVANLAAFSAAYPEFFADTQPLNHTAGYALVGGAPFLVVVRPVTTNSFEDSSGFILVARELSESLAEDIATRISSRVRLLETANAPAEAIPVVADSATSDLRIVAVRSNDTLTTYLGVSDISGRPIGVLAVDHSRQMLEMARDWWTVLVVGFTGLLVFVGLASYVTFQQLVLSRISSLARDVRRIGEEGEHGRRLDISGSDEVAVLANSIDGMLTEIDAKTQELSATVEELEDITHRRDRLFVNMSHELRTPLNSIIGFSGLLASGAVGELAPEQHTQVQMVNRSGMHLLRLINDVLDLARLRAVGMGIDPEDVPVGPLLEEVADMVRPLENGAGVEVIVEAPALDVSVHTDRGRLLQVLLNLASNAMKFTTEGSVALRATATGDVVNFSVEDTGCGIEPADLARVMDEFTRVGMGDSMTAAGTGLGLAISREIVERLGGNLQIRSAVGQGTKFTFSLPRNPVI